MYIAEDPPRQGRRMNRGRGKQQGEMALEALAQQMS